MCVAYDVDGVRHDEMPVNQTDFHHAVPIYEELARLVGGHLRRPHRSTTCPPTRGPTCAAVEEMSGARISAVGVGPERDADRRRPRPALSPA